MELYATDLHFIGDTVEEQNYDCCIHGKVVFKIGSVVLSDGSEEWCISASAYQFLHTLFKDHYLNSPNDNQLIPCCGHFLIPSEDGTTVTVSGCPNGIDFTILKKDDTITICTKDEQTYTVPFDEYASAVIAYAKQIENFYKQNPPRRFQNKFDKNGFSAFCNEWYTLMDKARAFSKELSPIKITFDDKIRRKNSFKSTLNELGAGFIIAIVTLVLILIGGVLLSFLPTECTEDLSGEFALFIGCVVIFGVLWIIAAIVHAIKKLKTKNTKREDSSHTKNSRQ